MMHYITNHQRKVALDWCIANLSLYLGESIPDNIQYIKRDDVDYTDKDCILSVLNTLKEIDPGSPLLVRLQNIWRRLVA